MKFYPLVLGLLAFIAFGAAFCQAGETIVDTENGFTLTLPDGFEPNAKLAGAAPNILHGFVQGDFEDDQLDTILFVEQLRGVIGRERIKLENIPGGFQGKLYTTKWRDYEIDAFIVTESLDDLQTITINAQVPIKGKAIQLKLFGLAENEPELRAMMDEILAGLHGESNWDGASVPLGGNVSETKYRAILLTVMIGLIVGGLVMFFILSRMAPPGTVLLIAVLLYVASFALAGSNVREVVGLVGVMRMLGFAGGIFGLINLVRSKRSKPKGT